MKPSPSILDRNLCLPHCPLEAWLVNAAVEKRLYADGDCRTIPPFGAAFPVKKEAGETSPYLGV